MSKKLSGTRTYRLSEDTISILMKLKEYNIVEARFVRQAIDEKIKNEWSKIKSDAKLIKTPF